MTDLAARLRRHLPQLPLAQAVRLVEMAARQAGRGASVGDDLRSGDEPARLMASDRMAAPLGEVVAIDIVADQAQVEATVLGLAGTSAALPPFYSEIQLQRRRLRDRAMADFLNIFDHRALSFFWRASAKYSWPLAAERGAGNDAVTRALLALAGLATPGARDRLSTDDRTLVPLTHHLSGQRRSAGSLALVLRHQLGLDVRVIEAEPTWMALPLAEQSHLGQQGLANARLGGIDATGMGAVDAAMLGGAVLDVQHHFVIAIGPLSHAELLRFCRSGGIRQRLAELCRLHSGLAYRPMLRLTIAGGSIPPLALGDPDRPALLGRTTWLGSAGDALRDDCTMALGEDVIAVN